MPAISRDRSISPCRPSKTSSKPWTHLKLDAGVVTPEFQSFPLDSVLSVLEASQAQAAAKGLKFKIRRSNLLAHSDPLLLQRVLQNLVSNAVRYTAKGGVLSERGVAVAIA